MPIWLIILLVIIGLVIVGALMVSSFRHDIEPHGFGEGRPTPPPNKRRKDL